MKNSNENGNKVLLVLQQIEDKLFTAVRNLKVEDMADIYEKLMIDNVDKELGVDSYHNKENGEHHLVWFNKRMLKPYPVACLVKVKQEGDELILLDIDEDDNSMEEFVRWAYTDCKPSYPDLPLDLNPLWDGEDTELLVKLANAYNEGHIFAQNYTAARSLYEIAAEKGNPVAKDMLKTMRWFVGEGEHNE